LPVNRVERAFRELLESGPNIEFDLNEQWVHLTVPAEGGEQVLEVATRVAQQLGLVLHDPQQVPPTHAETVHAERLVREGRPDEESPGAAELLRSAEAGDVVAMNNLGTCYAEGDGVTKSLADAAHWYGRAAAQNCLPAMLNLADCYRKGEGVPSDVNEAIRLYERVLKEEQCVSAFELGQIYAEGEGVERSVEKAQHYFALARANGHPEAYRALKKIGRAPSD
jgi:hypothetical protein